MDILIPESVPESDTYHTGSRNRDLVDHLHKRKPPALDTHASIASAVDRETGEVRSNAYDPGLKWQLQRVARGALERGHRIQSCYRYMRPGYSEVEICQADGGRPYFRHLQTCGSVWVCPVCAAKIQTVRAHEVRDAIDAHIASGGRVLLMTTTFRHGRQDRLEPILKCFKGAHRKFRGQRAYTRLTAELGLSGSIAGYETTVDLDSNGWHPHAHTLLFVRGGVEASAVRAAMFPLWQNAARRSGLEAEIGGFNVQDGSAVRTYVTKLGAEYQWGTEHELVKSHSKRGGKGGMTPFDLLRASLADAEGPWLTLFAEFAHAFKGKNQLTWSRGLKKRLLATEGRSDEEIAASLGQADPVIATISDYYWRIVRRLNHQAELLQIADLAGGEGVRNYLGLLAQGLIGPAPPLTPALN